MLTTNTILPTIKKYTNDICPIIASDSMWNHLECEMIRLALRSAELELKGALYTDKKTADQNDQLLGEIQTAIHAEATRLYGARA